MEQAKALERELKSLKDDIHRRPELSFEERRTTAIVKEKLTALGLEIVDLGMETGVVAVLRGGLPGGTVALRADIDAIAQQEAGHEGVVSCIDGIMHGCGHDFHTVGLYEAAKLLSQNRETLKGTVVFLLQPAEEVTQGAQAMIDHGLYRGGGVPSGCPCHGELGVYDRTGQKGSRRAGWCRADCKPETGYGL